MLSALDLRIKRIYCGARCAVVKQKKKGKKKMKKLMIAAAIVCAAVVSQAADYKWSSPDSYIWSTDNSSGEYPAVAAGTPAYFAFVNAYSQEDLVNDFAAGNVNYGKFAEGANNVMNADGGISDSAIFSANYTSAQQAYFVIFENGYMFISDEATAGYLATGTTGVVFPDQRNTADWESIPFQNAADGYGTAGWYQTAAVPEPTSGLLLLLGVAGLALKRKRA